MKFKLTEMEFTERNDNVITDFEENPILKTIDPEGEPDIRLNRYAVWVYGVHGKSKHEVAETSDDLEYLMKKYNVPKERIFKTGKIQ